MGVSVRFLGTGDAFNARGRCHSSYLVSAPGATILLDCGASALVALQRDGVGIDRLDAVCLSHLHGDHFAGLPFIFIAATFDVPRQRPLTIVGPPGTAARVADLYRAMYRDLASKPLPFPVHYVEVGDGARTPIAAAELLAFAVPHQEHELSLGYRLAIENRVVLYSGDTGWSEVLVTQSQGADLFICECCFFETKVDFHIDYPRLAAERHRFGCRRLVLSHCGREVLAHRDEIAETIASDGLVVDL